MPNPHLSILVVDDTKFSSAIIGRALKLAGYLDVRFASSAVEALTLQEERAASVLLADWMMPEIDGLELTSRIRQLDEMTHHYTYVILLTGREGENVLGEAFENGVDDFINKAEMHEQLVPRVFAADRLCNTLQRLLQENHLLTQNISSLEQRNLVDPLTGLGNTRLLKQRLTDSLRQLESRGGALCYLLIGLPEASQLRMQHGEDFHSELLHGIARRLQQHVRPLDVLVRLDDNHFGLIALMSSIQECTPNSFKRLHESLNLKAFKTSEGFITLKAGISLVSLDAKALPLTPQELVNKAAKLLPEAYSSGRINVSLLSAR
jgi:diguanylate cyclase (GGDEF)-like protein